MDIDEALRQIMAMKARGATDFYWQGNTFAREPRIDMAGKNVTVRDGETDRSESHIKG